MSNKGTKIVIIVVIIIILVIIFAATSNRPSVVTQENNNPIVTANTTTTAPIATSTPAIPVATTTVTVTYTDSGFTPSNIIIHNGDTVVFKNSSSRVFWPASNDHPTHTIYPEFDPKKIIDSGKSWSFTFTRVGTWGYHDHRRPAMTGTVTVQ